MKSIFSIVILIILSINCFAFHDEDFSLILIKQEKNIKSSKTELAVLPKLLQLNIGAVRPKGWILDWATTALTGVTGHLDEYSILHKEAWKGKAIPGAIVSTNDGTGWPLEQGAYWLDGAIRLGYILNDSILINKVSRRLDEIVENILDNDTIHSFIYWRPNNFVAKDSFDNWAHSQMGRALVAYYQATGNQRVLDALLQVYRYYPLPILPNNFRDGYVTGAINLDAMMQTYFYTGDPLLAENIRNTINKAEFEETIITANNGGIDNGHGVCVYENTRIPALAYLFNGNKEYLNATLSILNRFDKNHLLPIGIYSSEEWLAGIGSTRNVETCNTTAAPLLYQRLMEITGNGIYGDRIERVFFNALPVAASRDCKNVAYYQSLNRIEGVLPGDYPTKPTSLMPDGSYISPYDYRPTGHRVLCCVSKYTQAIPNYIMNMWMATIDNGLACTLYGPCQVETFVGKKREKVNIECHTNYPFDDNIEMNFVSDITVSFPLYIRIPGWCNNPRIKVNGKEIALGDEVESFVRIHRKWKKGDKIELNFPMQVSIVDGNETNYPADDYYQIPNGKVGTERSLAKRTDINFPFRYINYGPLLFSLPVPDIALNKMDHQIEWRYALYSKNTADDIKVVHKEFPKGTWLWGIDQSPIQLEVNATLFDWNPIPQQPLPNSLIKAENLKKIHLIPYGCTRYRITLFPLAD